MKVTIRKCPTCGTINENRDYCTNCGALINTVLRRKKEREKRKAQKDLEASQKEPNPLIDWFENSKEHPNRIIRYTAKFFYSIWILILAIGVSLALIVSYIAA